MSGLTIDYSAIVSAVQGQLSTALTAALPVAGALIGIYAGYSLFRRFVG